LSRLLNIEMKVVAPIRVGHMSLARYRPGQRYRGLPADNPPVLLYMLAGERGTRLEDLEEE
jgi:hypothetical protein